MQELTEKKQTAPLPTSTKLDATLLFNAIEEDNQEVVLAYIAQRLPLDCLLKCLHIAESVYPRDQTPLITAVRFNRLEIIRILLCAETGAGVNLESGGRNSITPLYCAAENGYISAATALLEANATVDHHIFVYRTPLYAAAEKGHISIVTKLLEWKAVVDLVNEKGRAPLYITAQNGHLTIATALLEAKATVNQPISGGWDGGTPLYAAAEKGHISIVTKLLEWKAVVDLVDENGWTPLRAAAKQGHATIVAILLEATMDQEKSRGIADVAQEAGRRPPIYKETYYPPDAYHFLHRTERQIVGHHPSHLQDGRFTHQLLNSLNDSTIRTSFVAEVKRTGEVLPFNIDTLLLAVNRIHGPENFLLGGEFLMRQGRMSLTKSIFYLIAQYLQDLSLPDLEHLFTQVLLHNFQRQLQKYVKSTAYFGGLFYDSSSAALAKRYASIQTKEELHRAFAADLMQPASVVNDQIKAIIRTYWNVFFGPLEKGMLSLSSSSSSSSSTSSSYPSSSSSSSSTSSALTVLETSKTEAPNSLFSGGWSLFFSRSNSTLPSPPTPALSLATPAAALTAAAVGRDAESQAGSHGLPEEAKKEALDEGGAGLSH